MASLRWSLVPDVGPVLFGRIVERFGGAEKALGASAGQLQTIEGIGRETAGRMARARDGVDVQGELELAARHGVRIICREDDEYPPALAHIPDPPICLYVRGRIDRLDALAIGIVGSRRCTIYGREQARRFGQQLAGRSVTVVSGLARGIDGEAHKGALEAEGRTIAVLGNGLSTLYPPEHADLAERIVSAGAGAIVSELPMATSPDGKNFPPRNRIIAGLSLGVLVIEAARRSGSLTTARVATEYNREVFAVPGRIDSEFSWGANALIRDQHAKLVSCVDDITAELGEAGEVLGTIEPERPPADTLFAAAAANLGDDERRVLEALDQQGQSIEAVADATGLPPGRVASILVSLQLKGLARQLPGNLFVRGGAGS